MKQLLALLLTAALCLGLLTACSGSSDPASGEPTAAPATADSEGNIIFDAGSFTVTVPAGWLALESGVPDVALIGKGVTEADYGDSTKPWIGIESSDTEHYDFSNVLEGIDSLELGQMTFGDLTYQVIALTTETFKGYAMIADSGDICVRVSIQYDSRFITATLDDDDVKALLGSIKLK